MGIRSSGWKSSKRPGWKSTKSGSKFRKGMKGKAKVRTFATPRPKVVEKKR